jgi:hypothetical protein
MSYREDTLSAIAFIQKNTLISCEIDYGIERSDMSCVWVGISLKKGKLKVNPNIAHPGDLLHEAGHIAITPLDLRSLMSNHLDDCEAFVEAMEKDDRLIYASDSAATGWAILACIAIGFEILTVFVNGFNPGEEIELAESATISTGTLISNRWMCELYYLGMIEKKSSVVPKVWDMGLLLQS